MSTRALYHFKDENETFTVYKHHDGYPSGAYEFIKKALPFAWALPRFEADEFGCSFIAANKEKNGGSIRLVPHGVTDMGQDYDYFITCENDELMIEFEYYNDSNEECTFKGTFEKMKSFIETGVD